jgi:uncharacterized protein (TIGR02145 family)
MKNTIKKTALAISVSALMSGSVFAACSADIDMGSKKITNMATPTAALGAANKGYVDNKISGFMKDGDGNYYSARAFGGQLWTVQNLKTTKAPDGGDINGDASGDSGTWANGKWAKGAANGSAFTTQDDSIELQATNGYYYTWDAAMNGATAESSQGLCGNGWHVPTDAEYNTLEKTLGADGTQDAATGWRYGADAGEGTPGTEMKDSTKWNGVLAGARATSGAMANRDSYAYFWSSSESGSNAFARYLNSTKAGVYRNAINKATALLCVA